MYITIFHIIYDANIQLRIHNILNVIILIIQILIFVNL